MARRPDKPETFRFVIKESFTKKTLPLKRLAEYLRHLATLLGESEHVHFDRLETGSVAIVQEIDRPAVPKVRQRLTRLRSFDAPLELVTSKRELDDLLASDNARAVLFEGKRKLLEFEGKDLPKRIGPVVQNDSIDGILIRIGGTGSLVWADIQSNDAIYHCTLDQDTARTMAPFIYGGTLRVSGEGIWYRDSESGWKLERLRISRFEKLSDENLTDAVERLRAVKGSGWAKVQDPLAELERIRHGES